MLKFSATRLPSFFLAAAILVVTGSFGWFLSTQGRTLDFQEFLLDRREGQGQTAPDRSARCSYQLSEQSFTVTRKAHGQTATRTITLPDKRVEGFFGGQEALIETATTAETFNCTNGEHLSQPLDGDAGDPISRVLFATSGRNVAVVLRRDGKESGLATFKFKVDLGDSRWNLGLGPDQQGLAGRVAYARLVGESLLVGLEAGGGRVALHTYNFRRSHEPAPWNAFDPERKPFVVGKLVREPEFVDRGKRVRVNELEYDYTCRLTAPAGEDGNPRPCEWREL